MKKITFLILLITITLCFLVGCNKNYVNQTEVGTEMSNEILRCLNEKDTEALKGLFCKYTSENSNLDMEIKGAYSFINGEIESHDEFLISGGRSFDDGILTDSHIIPVIKNIKTANGDIFKITYLAYIVCADNEDYIGVQYITIRAENDTTFQIGKYVY